MINPLDYILQVVNSTAPATLEKVNQVAGQSQDALLATGIGAVTGISALAAKVFKNNSDTKNEIRETDEDLAQYIELLDLEDKYTLKYPEKSRAEILNLPAYPDDERIKITLAEAKAKECKEWKEYREFLKVKYYKK